MYQPLTQSHPGLIHCPSTQETGRETGREGCVVWLTPGLQEQTGTHTALPAFPSFRLAPRPSASVLACWSGEQGQGRDAGLLVELSWEHGGRQQRQQAWKYNCSPGLGVGMPRRPPRPAGLSLLGRVLDAVSVVSVRGPHGPFFAAFPCGLTLSPGHPLLFRHLNTALLVVNHSWTLLWASLLLDWGSALVLYPWFLAQLSGTSGSGC